MGYHDLINLFPPQKIILQLYDWRLTYFAKTHDTHTVQMAANGVEVHMLISDIYDVINFKWTSDHGIMWWKIITVIYVSRKHPV